MKCPRCLEVELSTGVSICNSCLADIVTDNKPRKPRKKIALLQRHSPSGVPDPLAVCNVMRQIKLSDFSLKLEKLQHKYPTVYQTIVEFICSK